MPRACNAVEHHYRNYAGSSQLARARFRSSPLSRSHVRAGGARMVTAAEKSAAAAAVAAIEEAEGSPRCSPEAFALTKEI